MRIVVSHGTVTVDGQAACSRCGGPRGRGRKDRYCRTCRRDYSREQRAGMVQALLTPEEWGLILERRAAGPAGSPLAPAGPVTAPGPQAAAGQPVPARSPESSGGLG